MFSVKSIHSKLRLLGNGVLVLLLLMGTMIGCSSSGPKTDDLYTLDEDLQAIDEDENSPAKSGKSSVVSKKSPAKSGKSSSQPAAGKSIPSYSPADRKVVLRYAEKGEDDSANLDRALKLVQRAEKLSTAERVMEDYLVLTVHYRLKGVKYKVVQYANQGITAKTTSKRVKAHMFIHLGYINEKKSPTIAKSYFKQAAQIDPDFYKGNYELGRISFEKKEYSTAEAAFKKVLDLNPENADVYGMLGQMFYDMDRYEEAAAALEKALVMSPQTHWLHIKLGDTYFYRLKKREEGGRHYRQAVEKNDSDPDAHFGMALYYRYKSDYGKAEGHLKKAVNLAPRNQKYKRELDDMLSEQSEMAKGIQKHKQAIASNRKDPGPVARLGKYYLRWGKYDLAEEYFEKSVEVASLASGKKSNPTAGPSKVPEHANNLGWFYFNNNKYDRAVEAFKKALKVNPKHTPAQFGLGRTYENLEQYDMAASHYTKAAALDPDNQEAQKRLDALELSGKLTPVAEVIEAPVEKKVKKSVMKVRKKSVMKVRK